MCGICGAVSADRRQVEPAVRRMTSAMIHRGPNDAGYAELPLGGPRGPTAGFGFRRLSILDLSSAGHQPMVHPDTGDCLIFNGEIYNFRSLRRQLEEAGQVFRSTGDTEVLLRALATWGEAALDKLEGMYAFAFYDARSARILLARDPLGIKPLYVARLPDRFLFASEIRPLLASGIVPDELDVGGIAGMLAYGAVQSPRTIYSHIRAFPAGHAQWIDARITAAEAPPAPRRFWSFPAATIDDDRDLAAERVRQLVKASVLKHLVADVPVGVFLSAGIDSTIIASYAREYTPRVTAFTVGFGKVHGEDEVALSAATAKSLGIDHVAVDLDAGNMPGKWHDWLASMDSPSIDGFNTYVVSRRLVNEGVVVGLSGLGADELFGGYNTFTRAPEMARILQSLAFIPESLRAGAVSGLARFNGRAGAAEKLADIVSGEPSIAGVARGLRRTLSNQRLAAIGLPAWKAKTRRDYLDPLAADGVAAPADDPFNIVARIEAEHYMRDTLLRDTDSNSMRHSLEVRVPFLDIPLVNYVSALRGCVKRDGRDAKKALLREAAKGVLPPAVANRPKTGFTLPIGAWMRGAMRESCAAAIDRVAGLPFLEGQAVNGIWQAFLRDPKTLHWSRPLSLVVLGSCLAYAEAEPRAAFSCVESPA